MRYQVESSTGDGQSAAAILYAGYSALFLGVALGLGGWLRAVYVWPWLKGPFTFTHLVQAHSQGAFLGWVTPALFALIVLAAEPDAIVEGRLRVHAHALAILSGAAMVSFALTGYSPASMAISAGQVVLWYLFAIPMLRRLGAWGDGSLTERRFYRAALVLLLLAGAAIVLPGMPLARGTVQPWLKALSVELFLTSFIDGWLVLGVMGTVYGWLGEGRWSGWARVFTALGVLPAALLFVAEPSPWPWTLWLGRAGLFALGLGGLAFALDLFAAWFRAQPLLRLASLAVATKGALDLLASLGIGIGLLHNRSILLAYLHLILLGLVTPVLLAAYRRSEARPSARGADRGSPAGAGARTITHALGLTLMCGALVGLGWPALGEALASLGVGSAILFASAFAGGALSIVALLSLLLRRARARIPRAGEAAAGHAVHAGSIFPGVK